MLSIYIDTEKIDVQDSMAAEIKSYIAFVKSARTADGHSEVLVPGETERQVMAKRQKDGLPLTAATWSDILGAARKLEMPESELNPLIS